MSRRPDTFIIGAPKSGTTSLHKYLALHPDIFMSQPKEPGYFARDVTGTHRRRLEYGDDEGRYLSLFAGADGAKRAGEGSTNYLMSRQAPDLIHDFNPDARIIAMVRNPVELVHSLHGQRIANGIEPILDFASAIDADDDRRAGRRLPPHVKGFGVAYRDNALLGEQVERWLGTFGRDHVHVIVFDDFARQTESSYASVLRFLGLDAKPRPESFDVYNARHETRPLLHAVYRSRMGRWIARTALPATVGRGATTRLRQLFGARRVSRRQIERPPLDSRVRRELEREFAADVEKLGRLLDRDLAREWFGAAEAG